MGTGLEIALIASTIGSTALSAVGQYQSGKAQKKAAEYNAKMQEMEAARAKEVGIENAQRKRRDNERRLASYRAQFARSGVASTGSYLDFMAGSASDLEIQALDIFNQAQTQATALTNEAASMRYSGESAYRAGITNSFSSILGGVSDATFKYASLKQSKPGSATK